MGAVESFIWHLLGYSAIPLIVLGGIFISSLIFLGLVRLLGSSGQD